MDFGSSLKKIRIEKGLNQQDIANSMNTSRATISSWESNRTEPSIDNITKLCDILCCTQDQLLDSNSVSTNDKKKYEYNRANFANNLKKYREELGLHQDELAIKLNVTQSAVSSWEKGRTEPNMGMLDKICQVFDCSRSELLGIEKKPDTYFVNSDNMIAILESMNVDELKTMQRLISYKLAYEEKKK